MDPLKTPAPLFAHQQEAVETLSKSLVDSSRVTAVMACGTGKTRVGAEVAGRVADAGSQRRLVVVPTLELVRQTMTEWARQLGRHRLGRVIAVCSDSEVLSAQRTGLQGELADTDTQVANEAAQLADLAAGPGAVTVACTYASLHILAQAQAQYRMAPPDIAVIDEAHRTAGTAGKAWAAIHYDDIITARRRLYLTATPRILDNEGDDVISMADERLYGPVAYRLPFATAIDLGLLARYRLVVPVVTNSEAHQLLGRDDAFLRIGRTAVAAPMLAKQLAVLRAAHEHGIRRMITYHATIAEAKWFATLLPHAHALLPPDQRPTALAAEHVHGRQTTAERRRALDKLARQEDGLVVVSNARVLSEGVDVPAVDAVCFLCPRSTIDTIQGTGRAMRLTDRSTPKTATIMVPVFLQEDQDPESALSSTPFSAVWQTVRALASHDETLHRHLETARRSLATPTVGGRVRLGASTESELPDWLSVTGIPVPPDFADAITVRTVRAATTVWPEYLQAAEIYRGEHGDLRVHDDYRTSTGLGLGRWVAYLRKLHQLGKLSPSQIEEWEAVGMTWSVPEQKLQELIHELREFKKDYGHLNVPKTYTAKRGDREYTLGNICATLRTSYSNGQVPEAKVEALNAEGFIWDRAEYVWNQFVSDCREFMIWNGHLDIPQTYALRGRNIGQQVSSFRSHPDRLTPEQHKTLDRIGLVWDSLQYRWDLHIKVVAEFKSRHGHLNIPGSYIIEKPILLRPRIWMNTCVQKYRRGKLKPERHQQLMALGMEFPEKRA
ncbi:Helicase associated domain protein [Streptomyces sp. WI04-05B]|uniref:Helicase n=2 Tax=Streptomyces turgidiscabies TaxID=85558 RepID=L7F501_STRT8|nr:MULTISPECIES: DEAD/DEAH box helicase [Streptomyces]ELP66194.1 helicase [Streptomyces turgidiscabies Car8]MDX2549018.1 Helicase associated domain protein [Streptomyces sp. WI04-05B]MDX2590357.1 Helicase associated domain protein [Streptomyces sp. WI04-05A]MDX3500241.1 Helicase associated domain protein [Streptomyces turgidiscabies]GAQ75928.1 helicase associated domain protein [Streptomyces turgidiscabies]